MPTASTRALFYIVASCCVLRPAESKTVESRPAAQSRVAIKQRLPVMPGGDLQATVVEVTYPPGAFSSPHTHPCPVIGYVLKGSLRFRVNNDRETVYRAGDTFYEAPNSMHILSENASQTEEAKFLAYFVCDGKQQLTKPVP